MEPRVLPPEPVPLVGGAFLQARPLVVGPLLALSLGALVASGAPGGQVRALGVVQGGMLAFFSVEALLARRRRVTERWLGGSLAATVLGIGAANAASGGLDSPALPMLFAPVGVAFAAFGAGRRAGWVAALAVAVLVALLALPAPFAPVPDPWRRRMLLGATLGSLLLLRLGVAGLADAHSRGRLALRRISDGALDEAAARMRSIDALGARVAHEIKNPLASVKGLASLLSEGEPDERRARRFAVLLGEVARIEQILADYLSFTRPLEPPRPAPVRLDELIAQALETVDARAEQQGAALLADGSRVEILADRPRLLEALLNLLTNALEAGATRVTVRWRRDAERAVIEVRDDGRGMTPDALARLGTPYESSRPGGTGLGVALARAAARQHGGELTYSSQPGQGTTAHMELPSISDPHTAAPPAPGPRAASRGAPR